jgi:hypothetical protein
MLESGLEATLKEADTRFLTEIDWEKDEFSEIEKKVLGIYTIFPETIVKNIVKCMYEAFNKNESEEEKLKPDIKGKERVIKIPPKEQWDSATSWTDSEKNITYPQIPESKFYQYVEELAFKDKKLSEDKIQVEDKTIVDDDIDDLTQMMASTTLSEERKNELELKRKGLLEWREFKIAFDKGQKEKEEVF